MKETMSIILSELRQGYVCFFSAHCLVMSFICTQFNEEIQTVFEVIERTQNHIQNRQRGFITSELKIGLRFIFCAYCLIIPYICIQFHEEILNCFKVIERTQSIG